MANILVMLADGFEEMEAIIPIDVWRRAGFNTTTVAIGNSLEVRGAHNIIIIADQLFDDTIFDDADMIFLPGGMPGAKNLDEHIGLASELKAFAQQGKLLGAICAAPMVLGHKQLLVGKNSTCFPGFEQELIGANYMATPVQTDGQIITGKGAGVAFEFALEVVSKIAGSKLAFELATKMQMSQYN